MISILPIYNCDHLDIMEVNKAYILQHSIKYTIFHLLVSVKLTRATPSLAVLSNLNIKYFTSIAKMQYIILLYVIKLDI